MRTGHFLPLLLSIVAAAAHLLPAQALAKSCSGGDCSGGGSSVCTFGKKSTNCDELLDTHMIRNRFDVKESAAYRDEVEPMLKELEKSLPDFATELRAGLDKKWYLSDSKLPKLSAEANGTQLPHRQVAVQYQNSNEIWVDRAWFKKRPKNEQAAIIVHELGVQMYLRQQKVREDEYVRANPHTSAEQVYRSYGNLITMSDVRQLTELLMTKPRPKMEKLQEEVKDLNLGLYLTGKSKARYESHKAKTYRDLHQACALPDDGKSNTSPRRLATGTILHKLIQSYQTESKRLYDNKKAHNQSATTEEEVSSRYLLLTIRYLSEARESGFANTGFAFYQTRVEPNGDATIPRAPLTTKTAVKGPDGRPTIMPSPTGRDQLDAICEFVAQRVEGPKKRVGDVFDIDDAPVRSEDAR